MDKAKPFCISKREVWEAYKRVKANRGAAGVDKQSIEEFDGDLRIPRHGERSFHGIVNTDSTAT